MLTTLEFERAQLAFANKICSSKMQRNVINACVDGTHQLKQCHLLISECENGAFEATFLFTKENLLLFRLRLVLR